MLVVDPRERASLQEIMSHPWMTKGFNSAPENFLPMREPLSLPLDAAVVEKMQGFDFGSANYINEQLTRVVESEEYQNGIRRITRDDPNQSSGGNDRKRGVFDFYKRRNSMSRDSLPPAYQEVVRGSDPLNAFSPLISIYYLAREKIERERAEANPGGLSLPHGPSDVPLQMPGLPSPEAAYTNTYAPEMPGEKATGGRSRPRARTNGEDEVRQEMKQLDIGSPRPTQGGPSSTAQPSMPEQPAKKEGTAMGLLRRFSTRRNKDRESERPPPPTLNIQPPQETVNTPKKSFSVRRKRQDRSPTTLRSADSQPQHEGLLSANSVGSKASKLLGRSTSVNSADYRPKRFLSRGNSDATSRPSIAPAASGSEHSNISSQKANRGVELSDPPVPNTTPLEQVRTPIAARTKSLGHARQESIQARRQRREESRRNAPSGLPEETDADLRDDNYPDTPAMSNATNAEISRPGGLKGLFSSSTTSSKPPQFIRHDIIRVLNQLGVEYGEIRGGFSCRHAPSINLDDVRDYSSPLDEEKSGRVGSGHQRRISFGAFRGKERDDGRDERPTRNAPRRQQPDQSFTTNSEGSEEYLQHISRGAAEQGRDMGATTTRVQDDTGERLVLRFDIMIVKIPLINLHGIQFKKVQGGMNQYRSMTQTILGSLRL